MPKGFWRLGLILLAFLGFSVLLAPAAAAHVQIIAFGPADGSRLGAAPAQVDVRLSENVGVQQGSLRVFDTRGTQVDDGRVFQPGDESALVAVRLRPGLGDGSYLVNYAFVSEDSHPVRGAFAFVVGEGPLLSASGAVAASTGTDTAVDTTFTVFKWGSFLGMAALGGLVFVLWCRPAGRTDPRVRNVLLASAAMVAVSGAAALLLQGPYSTGQGLAGVFSPSSLETTLSLPHGKLLILRLVAVAALAVLIRRLLVPLDSLTERVRFRYENLAMVTGFLVLLSFSASGHAVSDSVPFFTITADLAHLGGMAVWLGGLVQITLCLRRSGSEEELRQALARFSPLAAISVGVVAASGVYLGLRIVPSFSALWTTTYGILLLLKLSGFVVLLALANLGRIAVRRRMTAGGVATATRMRVTVATEVAIAAVVLLLAAILSTTAP
jgi:copper transport protein